MKFKNIKFLFLLVLCIIFFQSATAQDESPTDLSESNYELIFLNGIEVYFNLVTNEIISKLELEQMKADSDAYEENENFDFWDSTQVNAYVGVQVDYPFEINFTNLECVMPIDGNIVITSRFGRRRRGPHKGIDLDLEIGDSVRTILPGVVRFVNYSSGHGKTVIVRHENDIETLYAHLTDYNVNVGDVVDKSHVLGTGGITGNARGSHLHMEIRYKGININPEYFLNFDNDSLLKSDIFWVAKGIVNPLNHSSYAKSDLEVLRTKEMAVAYQKNVRQVYVVKKGDTLSGIAAKNNMRIKDIVSLNKVSTKSTLRIGQHLVISP